MTIRMNTTLLPCGPGFIRGGDYNGKQVYIMMDVLGFVNTQAKASEIARRMPTHYSYRCSVNGIPGRPNICLTLAGIERICKEQNLLTDDLVKFAEVEREKYPLPSRGTIFADDPIIEEEERQVLTEIVSSIENKELLIKLHKRMKRMENMISVIYEDLK